MNTFALPRHASRVGTIRVLFVLFATAVFPLAAMEPPPPGAIQSYIKDGSYAARSNFVKQIGNYRFRKDVAARTLEKLKQFSQGNSSSTRSKDGPAPTPLPGWQGMPTTGTNNVLVLLIEFPDYTHVNDLTTITNKLFGNGVPSEFPKESLRNYYFRSSYGKLYLQGKALGWYLMQHERNWYTTQFPNQNDANRAIIQEVISAFDSTEDFSKYDNNGDGVVDSLSVFWAGPDNGWGNFWWGYQWELYNPVMADGVSFVDFTWQWESRPVGSTFYAETIIHETGHALGLPDYYDYDSAQGPDGGVGGLDMMHGNYADHNSFSKFVLDWLAPIAIGNGSSNVTLKALAASPDSVGIMPNYTGNSPYTEYFVVENRYRTNNDIANPGNGLLIWHVDATPNATGQDFLYDNSYTEHKLLRLMEADGLEEIEQGDGRADAGDYYNQGDSFGNDTAPNSWAYDGSDTGVTVDTISPDAYSMTARLAIEGGAAGPRIRRSPTSIAQATLENINPSSQSFNIWSTGGTVNYAIFDDAAWLSVSPGSGTSSGGTNTFAVNYTVAGLAPGTYNATISITSADANNSPQTIAVSLIVAGDNIGRAVDATNLNWNVGGNALWFEQTTTSHDGVDSAQSGDINDSQTNWIQTSIQGPGQLSFWWKVSSEANFDYLRFLVDGGEQVQRISGSTDWQPNTLFISNGVHTVRWAYTKDASVSSGADAGWVDQVQFVSAGLSPLIAFGPSSVTQIGAAGEDAPAQTLQINNNGGGTMNYTITDDAPWLSVTPANETSSGAPNFHTINYSSASLGIGSYNATITITSPDAANSPQTVPVTLNVLAAGNSLAEAVDYPATVWTTDGDAGWSPEANVTHDGEDAVASGHITHEQYSLIETVVEGPGQMTFWWKASTEANYDSLYLFMDFDWDGLSIDGEVDWRKELVIVPPGSHTLSWIYFKDESVDGGLDTVWLDQVQFTPSSGTVETKLSTDFSSGLPPGWQIVDNAFYGANWMFADPCERGNYTGGSGAFALADSDCAGFVPMDSELISPSIDFTGYTNVILQFKSDFTINSYEIADVDVQINNGGWINLWRRTSDDFGPKTYNISLADAAEQPDVRVRFHYWNAYYDWFWCVDDVSITATSSAQPPHDYLSDWTEVWQDFDRNYSGFALDGIDWNAVYQASSNIFATVTNASDFAVQLNDTLQVLGDWQIAVQKPDTSWLGYNGDITNNHPSLFLTNYTAGQPYQNLNAADAVYHAWVFSNLAHIVVANLDDSAFAAISDSDLNNLFATYQNAKGLILDLRSASTGNETNALRIAARFTELPRTYAYSRNRVTGTDHNAFTAFAPKILQPSAGTHFTNNVVCLAGQETTDAAERLALMMKTSPKATLVGDRTRGASANPELFTQSDIAVSYRIPRAIVYDANQSPIQFTGVTPHLAIPPGDFSYNDATKRDYVLERAIAWLRRPKIEARRITPQNSVVFDWPAGPVSTYTLLHSTNLQTGTWQLAPGWTSNRTGFDGTMVYTNSAPANREFYRLEIGP